MVELARLKEMLGKELDRIVERQFDLLETAVRENKIHCNVDGVRVLRNSRLIYEFKEDPKTGHDEVLDFTNWSTKGMATYRPTALGAAIYYNIKKEEGVKNGVIPSDKALQSSEREQIAAALRLTNKDMAKTAKILGISERRLVQKVDCYHIN
ncbi:MAG TPA: hypothetical protein VJB94_00710 [Candidatus Nanoarchaeia archaeon]|nr:hypothetical protein [Candidatus Nanoarchaeia archaeon]